MLKERAKLVAYWVWTMDLVLTTVAFLLAWWLRSHVLPQLFPATFPTELYPLSRYLGLLPLVLAIWTFLLVTRESYTSRRTVALSLEAWHVVQVVGGGVLTLAAAGWLLRLDFVSRPFLILFGIINLALLLAEKLALRLSARHVRSRGLNYRTLLLVGINPRSEEVARVRLLDAVAGWWASGDAAPALAAVLEELVTGETGRALLGVNRWDGVLWYRGEAFDELRFWLGRVVELDGDPQLRADVDDALDRLDEAHRRSGYRVDRLLEGVSGR